MPRSPFLNWIRFTALIAVYALTGIAGLKLAATGGGYAAPIWPPTGIAIAAILLGGRSYLPAIWLGAFVTNAFIGQAISFSNFALSGTIATGNMLEALVAAWLLRGVVGFEPTFGKLRDVMGFIAAALVSPVVSATIGVAAVTLAVTHADMRATLGAWTTWWIGDALGALIVTPMLITLAVKAPLAPKRIFKKSHLALPAVLVLLSLLSMTTLLPPNVGPLFVGFLIYSLVVWCALVLPIRKLFFIMGALSVIMTVRAYAGWGLFTSGDLVQRFALLQFFLGCISVTMMILNAVVSERISALSLAHQQDIALMQSKKMSALGEMSSGIAHEISNPLLVIYGKIDQAMRLVESGRADSQSLLPLLEKIDSMARRIDKVIKAVRSYSRKADADPFRVVTVRSIVDDTLELCKDHFRNHHVELIVDPIPEFLELECRPVLIAQVLLNLLTNGLNAVETQEKKWVRIGAQTFDEDRIEIDVIDSGEGIAESMRDSIFKPFFTTKKAGEGTGLGLSVSRNIVESHHGSIQLDPSCPNTRFVVILPVRQPLKPTLKLT